MQQDEPIDLSVVIPIYNVEEYIGHCLRSVCKALGSLRYEVLLLDDGSTDRSGKIAESFAESHDGFRYILLPHGGQGRARNVGITQARGTYIQFTDADDVLLSGMLEEMVSVAKQTGSDIVMQNMARLVNGEVRPLAHALRCFSKIPLDGRTTSLAENPQLIYAWLMTNKVFVRRFLLENEIWFSEGAVFEDIYPGVKSCCLAKSISIMRTRGYYYREHDRQTSKNPDIASFLDRMNEVRKIFDYLDSKVKDPAARKEYELAVVWGNFWLPMAHPEWLGDQLAAAMDAMRDVLEEFISQDTIERLPVLQKQLVRDVLEHDVENFLEVGQYGTKSYTKAPIERKDGNYSLLLPENLFRIPERDAKTSFYHSVPISQVRTLEVVDGKLDITGHLFHNRIELESLEEMRIEAWMVNERTGFHRRGRLHRIKSEYLTKQKNQIDDDVHYCYDWSGFSLSFDVEEVLSDELMKGKNLILMYYKTPVSEGWRVLRGIANPVRRKLPNMQVLTDTYRIAFNAEPDGTLAIWVHDWEGDASQKTAILQLQEKCLDAEDAAEQAAKALEECQVLLRETQESLDETTALLQQERIRIEEVSTQLEQERRLRQETDAKLGREEEQVEEVRLRLETALLDLEKTGAEQQRLRDKLEKTKGSWSYRVGRGVTWLPKKVYRSIHRSEKK